MGSQTNDSAAAGFVGEYATNTASGVSLTTGAWTAITSVTLTAGDWDVSGVIRAVPAGSTAVQGVIAGINTTSGASAGLGTQSNINATLTTGAIQELATPTVRMSFASTTTVYLNANVSFTVSTATANGFIRARRVR
jgi:hypothetical protein